MELRLLACEKEEDLREHQYEEYILWGHVWEKGNYMPTGKIAGSNYPANDTNGSQISTGFYI